MIILVIYLFVTINCQYNCNDFHVKCVGPSEEFQFIQDAISNITDVGSIVQIRSGVYIESLSIDNTVSGDENNFNELLPFPNEDVTIQSAADDQPTIILRSSSYWKIHNGEGNLTIQNRPASTTAGDLIKMRFMLRSIYIGPCTMKALNAGWSSAIDTLDCQNSAIDGLFVNGVSFEEESGGFFGNVLYLLFDNDDNRPVGTYGIGKRIVISNNRFMRVRYSVITLPQVSHVTIENNYFDISASSTSNGVIHWYSSFFGDSGNDFFVRNNIFKMDFNKINSKFMLIHMITKNVTISNNLFLCPETLPTSYYGFITFFGAQHENTLIDNNIFVGAGCATQSDPLVYGNVTLPTSYLRYNTMTDNYLLLQYGSVFIATDNDLDATVTFYAKGDNPGKYYSVEEQLTEGIPNEFSPLTDFNGDDRSSYYMRGPINHKYICDGVYSYDITTECLGMDCIGFDLCEEVTCGGLTTGCDPFGNCTYFDTCDCISTLYDTQQNCQSCLTTAHNEDKGCLECNNVNLTYPGCTPIVDDDDDDDDDKKKKKLTQQIIIISSAVGGFIAVVVLLSIVICLCVIVKKKKKIPLEDVKLVGEKELDTKEVETKKI